MTLRERLEQALAWHGCTLVKTTAKGSQWTCGDLAVPTLDIRDKFLFIGNAGSFRHGRSRTSSFNWPKTRARLLAEPGPTLEDVA